MSFFKYKTLDNVLNKITDKSKSVWGTNKTSKDNPNTSKQSARPRSLSADLRYGCDDGIHKYNGGNGTFSKHRLSVPLSNESSFDFAKSSNLSQNGGAMHAPKTNESVDELDALLDELSENEDPLDSFERRNDREEIRRKLAMDSDSEEYYCGERVTRKPSLTTRLQSGMNLQICFMNETASDLDSQGSDQDSENGNHTPRRVSPADKRISSFMDSQKPQKNFFPDHVPSRQNGGQTVPNYASKPLFQDKCNGNGNTAPGRDKVEAKIQQQEQNKRQRPSFFFSRQKSWRLGQLRSSQKKEENPPNKVVEKKISPEEDFLTRHARLQAEARHALSQAKEMARMQMEVERQRKKKSPIADIVGIPFPDGRHRLSRQILTDMNVAQLQVIVNDLHSQIESLNEDLVRLLLERDDLNMEQDSMLVDIEDMTRFLGAKEEALKSRVVPKMAGLK